MSNRTVEVSGYIYFFRYGYLAIANICYKEFPDWKDAVSPLMIASKKYSRSHIQYSNSWPLFQGQRIWLLFKISASYQNKKSITQHMLETGKADKFCS